MIPEELEALALADAAGALDAGEQRELDRRLGELTADDQAEIGRLYDIAVAIALTSPPADPPADGLNRLMAAIDRPASPANYTLLAGQGTWNDTPFPGIRMKVLAVDRSRNLVTMLLRGEAGARYPSHRHSTCEECYVVSGSVVIEGRVLRAGDFHHAESDTEHAEIYTTDGAEVLLVGAIADYLPGYAS
jgi:anti-sigma factor ChrR (cupin superfamily)